ncbi:rod shape-determining protein MreC [Solitalea canadensis]|uniref:Cell shape-determining protein MreC n=1 Tax=Solitalea canadensis (strain ATCC 29591 / DSM 3403 / JCM 21819 / LMG 8368 / NBRC 15130 / NCIMB 12057 / USAM 9D) TaxID=929556 RepID=H8KXT0_SOLCM|nr:rod shape-determining protein MreC [Solitalea canadensis]AFD05495.1 cell shape-determining protein [Solitalea canadensis DSM 3403]
MRNLWLFILRFHAFFLFVIFETIAIILLIQNNNYQKTSFINSSNKLIGNLYTTSNDIKSYMQLGRVNDSLAAENAKLRNMLPSVFYNDSIKKKTVIDTLKQDSMKIQQYTYIEAKVVNNTISYQNNFLTLNRGARHGIKPGMGVICAQGVVGIVKDVSDNFCTVMSLLHKDSKISVKLASTNEIGSLVWEGTNPRIGILKEIPNHVVVKKGERVVTTGYSLFPENVSLGKVIDTPKQTGESLLNIEILLSTDFQRLQYVYVVQDKFIQERQKLESNLNHD